MAPHVGMRHAHVRMHWFLATETTWVGPAPFDRNPGLAAGTELLSILQYSCFFYLYLVN
jgi:hypothetical protein